MNLDSSILLHDERTHARLAHRTAPPTSLFTVSLRSASLPQRVSAGPIPATDTTGISPRSKWSKYAAGFVAGVLLTFGVEAVLTGKLAAGLFEQRPAWHLEDTIDVEALEIQQCAVQPSPRQIVYNRIGKAGSMSVSQALINVHKHNGFLWKNLPTGEYGTEQQALELVQQYVGLGLGCLELTSSSAQEDDGVQQTSKLRSGAGGVAPSDGSVGATAVATASLPEDVNLPACEKVIYIGHVFFFDLEDYLHQPHSSSSSTPRDNTDSRRITFQRPAYVNFLRDPVDRYLSQYSYWRTLPDIGPATVVAGATIEQCMAAAAAAAANSNSRSVGSKDDDDDGNDDHHLFGCPPVNYMTSYLCGLSPHCSDPPDYQTFLRAKRNLVEEYALVGITEHMGESMELFGRMFPDWFGKQPLRQTVINRTPKKSSVSAHTRALVEAAHRYDRMLYDAALELLRKRLAACDMPQLKDEKAVKVGKKAPLP